MNSANQLKLNAIEILKQLIKTPSISREESAVASLIAERLSLAGVKPSRYLNNVWAQNQHFDPAKPTLILNSHLDTISPNAGYTRNPFQASVEDGRLYGLGSNDAGASVVALMAAFLYFESRTDLNHNLIYAATAEEEISGPGGIEALLPMLPKISAGLVGEPTGMQMAVAEKGLLVLDCVAVGKSGHAARDEGENAIYKAVKDIEWFKEFKFDKVSPLLGPNKMTVTIIESGSQHNVVPQTCKFTVDMRLNEFYDFESVLKVIRDKVGSDVKPRSLRIKSTSIELEHPLVKAGSALGLSHYGSPTTSDKALMPFPALKIGPGESRRSHTADEYVELSEIEAGIDLYIKILEKVILQ